MVDRRKAHGRTMRSFQHFIGSAHGAKAVLGPCKVFVQEQCNMNLTDKVDELVDYKRASFNAPTHFELYVIRVAVNWKRQTTTIDDICVLLPRNDSQN